MKAFETPSLRAALATVKDKLLESQQNLEKMRTKCNQFENEIAAKENYFASHELALKESHQHELEKGRCFGYIFCFVFFFFDIIFNRVLLFFYFLLLLLNNL